MHPPHNLEWTLGTVRSALRSHQGIRHPEDLYDILYHLENFQKILNWLRTKEKDPNEVSQPD